jgi:hypothetical protein
LQRVQRSGKLSFVKVSLGRRVKAPDGTEWIVGRAWLGKRRPGSFGRHVDNTIGTSAWSLESLDFTHLFDGEDFVGGLIVAAVAVAFVLVIIPIILFGFELIIVGCVLAIGIVGSTFLGRPWTVVAKSSAGQVREWRIRGRRASAALIDRICTDIQASGQIPAIIDG